MSSFNIVIDSAQVQAGLAQLIRHVSDLTPIMEDIGAKLGDITEDAFQAEGPGWPQLKPYTVAKRGSAHPILQDTGGLAGSITHGGDRDSAWVGMSKEYAEKHQFGDPTNRLFGHSAPIPPRPFLPFRDQSLTPGAEVAVMAIINRALRAAIGQG